MLKSKEDLKRVLADPAFNGMFHEDGCHVIVGPRGGRTEVVVRWRQSGQLKEWKTQPDRFRLPIKHGLKTHDAIDKTNCDKVHAEFECQPFDILPL